MTITSCIKCQALCIRKRTLLFCGRGFLRPGARALLENHIYS